MPTDVLFPADRVADPKPVLDMEALKTRARGIIDAAVPPGGSPLSYADIQWIVRNDPECYVLRAPVVIALIDEVKASRPTISQVIHAEEAEPAPGPVDLEEIDRG